MSRPAPRPHGDEGFALLTVLGGLTIVTLFLLSSLAYALSSTGPSRADQDAKAALAAAQAGVEEFSSRLALDESYYADDGGVHSLNPAFTREVPVQGTNGQGAVYRYELLTTELSTGQEGKVRLAVTGCSLPTPIASSDADPTPCADAGGIKRDLVAEFRPDGFLKYIYFTDIDSADPALVTMNKRLGVGDPPVYSKDISDVGQWGWRVTYRASTTLSQSICESYYYAGRHQRTFTVGDYIEVRQRTFKGSPTSDPPTETVRTASVSEPITFHPDGGSPCYEIQFDGNDTVAGAAHSNDAFGITGAVDFTEKVTSAWGTAPTLKPGMTARAPDADGKLWWGDKTLTLPGSSPQHHEPIPMPVSNEALLKKADPAQDEAPGCLYIGQTTIRFAGTKMFVRSPGTTPSAAPGTPARCYNTGSPDSEQQVDVPPVVYVKDGPCGATGSPFPYPKPGELTGAGFVTTSYGCGFGNAFVSGALSGRVTVATSRDIIIVGDTTYQNGVTGTDALGLIPQGSAWVYHPIVLQTASCSPYPWCHFVNMPGVTPVQRIDAALLSVANSFVVQHWNLGAALSTTTAETACEPENIDPTTTCSKLTVRGSIIQKYRGAVGESPQPASGSYDAKPRSGYVKNYIYDERLRFAPPPFFLQPKNAWSLHTVSD